ncbi:large subunit ribosomal protein L25 [Rhodococcus sp. LBL1]|uniref:Large ribosomal subunit protein bL25 n=1 Tax=Prescottella agglutinans TaxID=1644129 RepID=A0ABT6MGJ0_9NOCA|nr:50S ribosomal protein L25/general stress protein Ctc [Prescottella agglutinans]MDH6283443.1 large subunit ribosomal protein L25 [Prescottella agglutinans]MDH6676211.1 large subunit ribosomal protein L25 [Rhodococcus sp. LBL1]MDH6681497.1 large subunit ribosomal protein L25 [Rhodococcus sp. LBL2]
MSDENRLVASVRSEFGKGAARRARRDGQVPAVVYGHGTDPQHLNLPAREFAAILRAHGTNVVINLDIDGKEQLALTKSVVVHPIRRHIEHADLLIVQKGEKVAVEVPIVVAGTAAPGALVTEEVTTIKLEVEALHIPESVEVSVEGAVVGTQILAGAVALPKGATLADDAELLLVNVVAAQAAEPAAGEETAAEAEA